MSRTSLFGVFMFLCYISIANSGEDVKTLEIRHPTRESDMAMDIVDIAETYKFIDKETKNLLNKIIRALGPMVMKEVYKADLSMDCLSGLLKTVSGIKKLKIWAVAMLDASAKIPEGFFSGTLGSLGNYDECLNIDVVENKMKIQGQYCYITVTPPVPEKSPFMSVHIRRPETVNVTESGTVIDKLLAFAHNVIVVPIKAGVCIPSMCTVDDLQKLIQIIPQKTGLNFNFTVKRCEVKSEKILTDIQKAILITFGIVGFFLVLGTVVDLWFGECSSNENGTTVEILRCFSVTSSIKKICTFEAPDDTTRFAYGIVFISFIWADCANTLYYANYSMFSNMFAAVNLLKMYFYEALLNRTIAMQNLFFVSGLINAYRVIKADEDICVWKYLFYRFMRYTPAYMMAIGLVMLTPLFGSGPTWADYVLPMYNKCRDSWWTNIFYVNNFIDPETSCLDNTWFVAVDAQLHALGLLVLIPLKRKPKLGLILCFGVIVTSLMTVVLTNLYYDLPPAELSAFIHPTDRAYYASHTFNRVYSHLCTYCSGIIVGYLIVKKPSMNISKKMCLLIWIVLVLGVAAVLISIHHWHMGEYASNPLGAALYAAFSKVALAVSLSWTGYICCTGKGGIVNSILGWHVFPGLCRLMFMALLFNPVVINLITGYQKTETFVGHFEVLYLAVNFIIPTFMMAAVCYVAFEGPVIALNEMMRRRGKSTSLPESCRTKVFQLNRICSEKPMKLTKMKH